MASSHTGDGGTPSVFSLVKTRSSTKFCEGGRLSTFTPKRDIGPEHGYVSLVAGHHGHVAGQIERLDQAQVRDFGHLAIVGIELREPRHILDRAVGVVRQHGDLLLAADAP